MTQIGATDGFSMFAPPPSQGSRGDLGQEDFLTLMISQFKNQDPFEPMDNGQFLGQLAQFSTVNGIESLNSSFAQLAGTVQNEQALQAADLVGHSVLAVADSGYLPDGGAIKGGIELGSSASNVQIDILDSTGELLKTIDLGQQPAGMARFAWDGLNSDGELQGPGQYQIKARVIRGANVESTIPLVEGEVESVTLGVFGQAMTLNLSGGSSLSLNQVYQII